MTQSVRAAEESDVEILARDEEFVPVLASYFLCGLASPADVYARMLAGRYVRVLRAGEIFPAERLETYLATGVRHLYLQQAAHGAYLRQCEQVASRLAPATTAPQEIRIARVLAHGQQTATHLLRAGLSPDLVQYAQRYAENVISLVKTLDLERHGAIREYLRDLEHVEHGAATAMISSLLSIPLKLDAGKDAAFIGLASLFHDIGLTRLPKRFSEPGGDDEDNMTPSEFEEYHRHPAIGAEMLREIREIDPIVARAVEQHHERRNRKLFAGRTGQPGGDRVAEMIGIGEEFLRYLRMQTEGKVRDPIREMEKHAFAGFSSQTVAAFRLFFGGPKK
jgi:putative nucleotidyltransferase with HDIG domain